METLPIVLGLVAVIGVVYLAVEFFLSRN